MKEKSPKAEEIALELSMFWLRPVGVWTAFTENALHVCRCL
ncbi:hypothetical protein CHCC14821_0703 [Bacillus paralicheniformis]|nr:hypothetical protein CHCC14821_0703 [Bacillus paralicheniformis]TWM66984.1 hypothetical protein CHCC14814_1873 [Bacillus paralicheniformis]